MPNQEPQPRQANQKRRNRERIKENGKVFEVELEEVSRVELTTDSRALAAITETALQFQRDLFSGSGIRHNVLESFSENLLNALKAEGLLKD